MSPGFCFVNFSPRIDPPRWGRIMFTPVFRDHRLVSALFCSPGILRVFLTNFLSTINVRLRQDCLIERRA